MVDWYHYTNPFYMKLKIPIDMKISNVEKKWGKALDVTYVDDGLDGIGSIRLDTMASASA